MKQIRTEAIVLRRTDFGEADRIVNFLTPNGQISAVAKGVRKPKSKLAGGIEIFAVNEIVLIEGKSELKTLTSARNKEFFSKIVEDLNRTEIAYDAIKRASRASEFVENPAFFDLLLATFSALNDFEIDENLTRNWFLLNLAEASGETVNFETDNLGQALQASEKYTFNAFEKCFEADFRGQFDARHIKFLRLMLVSEPKILSKVVGGREILREVQSVILGISG